MSSWQTSVSRVDEGRVLIRGYDLESLIGGQSFTSSCFLLVRRTAPSCPMGDEDCPLFG